VADPETATPLLGDVTLSAVQHIRQETDGDLVALRIPALDGMPHQRLGRRSHRVTLSGVLVGDTAADDLSALQKLARDGTETTFTADIVTALEVQNVVVESLAAEQVVGRPGQYAYTVVVAENPPLPPPAEVSSFGGLEGFGDLGFDGLDDVLSGIADQAGALTDALDSALDAVGAAAQLAGIGDLSGVGNPLKPLTDSVGAIGGVGDAVGGVLDQIKRILG
jgi:phage protein U